MSDIVEARRLMTKLIRKRHDDKQLCRKLRRILKLMYREKLVRPRAKPKRVKVDPKRRAVVLALAKKLNMTQHQIAQAAGLRSAGRVSEILHQKR